MGLAILLASSISFAEGSEGSGAPVGDRQNWPCPGCIMHTPAGYNPAVPTSLVVAFHGDEGDPGYIEWKLAEPVAEAGMLMLSLKCPNELGCNQVDGSWWQWEAYVSSHDATWVGAQVDAVEAEYNVELQRVFLVGFSGGSSYLSWYARDYADRYAAVAYLAGGYAPWNGMCAEPCPIPAYFLIGSQDFLLDGAEELSSYYQSCGHEVVFDLHPGVDHEIINAGVPDLMNWLGGHEHLCREEPEEPEPPAGGCTQAPDCGACVSCIDTCMCQGGDLESCYAQCDELPENEDPGETTDDGGDNVADDDGDNAGLGAVPGGCACSTPRPSNGSATPLFLLALLLAPLHRRRRCTGVTGGLATRLRDRA